MQVRTFDGPGVRGESRSSLRVWFTALVVLVTAVALVAVAPRPAAAATVENNVPYLLPNGHTGHANDVTVLDNSTSINTLTNEWYLVRGSVTSDTITVSGDNVHLILEDGSSLTATGDPGAGVESPGSAGIKVSSGNSLEIFAQSKGGAMGKLSATGGFDAAGIGGNEREAGGTITINGGMVTATSDAFGAGIGGGYQGAGGTITINGGIVTATNTHAGGAGIGGGNGDASISPGGTITINGGTVTATATNTGAGIGGGREGGTTTINGGKVTATGGSFGGAGIGGGSSHGGAGGTIVIGGGDVTATGGGGGAGIGGSRSGYSGAITVTGTATVRATGGNAGSDFGGGAGIGSGGGFEDGAAGAVGKIIINATDVTATGGAGSSGEGAGAKIGYGGSLSGNGKEITPGDIVTFHTVTITQARGGSVSAFPQGDTGSVQVPEGANQTFLIEPHPGFAIHSVSVDGNEVGAVDSWTIPDITGPHTITATFANAGGLVTVSPARLMDTRRGLGATGPVGANTTIHLPVLGHGGVPASGVKAVVLNVTATAPTATSFVTVWADGEPRPGTSNLNFTAGQTVPNLVIAPVGKDGMVDFYNRAGTVQLVADVSGWFAAGSPVEPGGLGTLTPDRVMDTRTGLGTAGPVGPGETVSLPVLGHGGVPADGVGAVVLNVTVTQPTAAHSFVTVWPDGRPRPGTSSLNFTAGQTRANLVIVPVGADGKVNFFNSAGDVQIVADVSGWFAAGAPAPGGLAPLEPTRILDTRIPGVGGFIGPVGPGETVKLPVLGHAGIPTSGVEAVVLNVTATEPTATGFVTVWADGQTRPATSNLNFTRGQTVANAVIAPVGADGEVDFYNSAGNTQLVADVSGWFAGPANGPPSP